MTTATPAPGAPTWTRPLGSTGLQVSAVCAGGSPLGSMPRLYGRDVSANEGIATAHAVLQSPIRFIDTSNGYSDGENERRIGKAIAASGGLPDGFVVATRSTRAAATTPETGSVRRSPRAGSVFAWTTCRLVHLHDPENFDFDEIVAPGGAVDALVGLKKSGEVGSIGLAGGCVHEMALGVFDGLLVHNRWTLLDRSAGALIVEAVYRGMGIINAAVYGGGILARQGGGPTTYGYRLAPPEILEATAAMRRARRRPHDRRLAVLSARRPALLDRRRHESPRARRRHGRGCLPTRT